LNDCHVHHSVHHPFFFVQVLVINYSPPNHYEDYVHRVGRTGRGTNKGTAITYLMKGEDRIAGDLVKALKAASQEVPPAVSVRVFVMLLDVLQLR
jgi:superfamily II DNA/RNA helicase